MTYILKYTVNKSLFYLRTQATLKIRLFIQNPLSYHTFDITADPPAVYTLHHVWQRCESLNTHAWCCSSGSTLHCQMQVYLYPWGQGDGRQGKSAQVNALLPSPSPRSGQQLRALALSHGKTNWLETNCQWHTVNRHPNASRPLCTHTEAFFCSLVRWRPHS